MQGLAQATCLQGLHTHLPGACLTTDNKRKVSKVRRCHPGEDTEGSSGIKEGNMIFLFLII